MRVLRGSPGRGDVNPSFGTVLPGLWSPLSNYLVSFFTPDWSLHPPQDVGTTFAKIDPPQRPVGACPHLLWDGAPPFLAIKEASCPCTEKSSSTSGVGPLSLYSHRLQLLPLDLPLECVSENKGSISLQTNTSCPAQRPLYLLCQILLRDMNPKNFYWEAEGRRSVFCSFFRLAWGS